MKKVYLLVIVIVSLIVLALYSTYAMFTADLNIGEFVELTASTLPTEGYTQEYETIGIDAYQSKTINLNIKNSTSNSLYYGVWYEMKDPSTINSNIKIGLLSTIPNPVSGQVASNETKLVKINVFNNTNNAIVINIGAGYSTTSSLNLPSNRTLVSGTFDTEAPSLSLEKVTYLDVPFDNKWTYNGSTATNGVLSYDGTEYKYYATSPYVPVDGQYWYITYDAYVTNKIPNQDYGQIYFNINYYDSEYNTTTINGYEANGRLNQLETGKWVSLIFGKPPGIKLYEDYLKYIKLDFISHSTRSIPPIKLRNLKVYGQMKNNFYNINITANDNIGVTTTKCAKGIHSKEYFKENGTIVNSNQITVTENGIYTVYVEDAIGNSTIDTVEITNINIPTEYQRVEFISSTGTQYIDTGVSPSTYNGDYEVEIKEKHSANSSNMYIIGTSAASTNEGSRANIRINSGGTVCNAFANNSTNTSTTQVNQSMLNDSINSIRYTVSTTNTTRELEINGNSSSSTTEFISVSTSNFKLFGLTSGQYVGNIYEAKIYGKNDLVRSFVPCYRKSDGEIGLYDTVNNVFYTNIGTGTFSKGENIPTISS